MRLLLDTHIWIWARADTARIRPDVAAAVQEQSHLWLSPVTIWETISLFDSGKLVPPEDPIACVRRWLEDMPIRDAPLNREVAIMSRRIRIATNDPADRFLAATAIVHDLILVTADRHLIDCKEVPTLANR
jgi:PIN domain nuclease of toxin-antitoxin system